MQYNSEKISKIHAPWLVAINYGLEKVALLSNKGKIIVSFTAYLFTDTVKVLGEKQVWINIA